VFRWEGAIEESREAVLLLKTTADRAEALIARLRELHDYEIPCIVTLPILGGNPDFLAWIASETGTG
jgi:periplasmic divalent cation tolerance protein